MYHNVSNIKLKGISFIKNCFVREGTRNNNNKSVQLSKSDYSSYEVILFTIIDTAMGKPYNLTRNDETIINRLKIKHSRLTHGYLMSKEEPLICELD
ncbi:Uncharacterized protein FWK35_00015375 [Aphis craccivora]|uniref:Uncharacterized protein n=1 Tax=Aphis craccivora TaxID=307492 RepID=A0A6G0YR59_APHCR|nr:Uncharacterized protein FWK35_00015375 [Aphis craccivora]